jgi:cytochrome bd-type quinol oxidase subunit 1
MSEAEVLQWIKDLPIGAAVRQSRWLFGLGETLHFIGLCLMVGGLLIVDLRVLGYIRGIPMRAALAFLPFVIVGFLINLATGTEFFMTDPFMYWPNPAFKLKMFMVLLGGINALVFTVMEHRHLLVLGKDEHTSRLARITAGTSLAIWLCVILLGRLLPTFEGSTSFF